MATADLNQASAIAGIGGFFVAVVGLALALGARSPTGSHTGERSSQQMSDVIAGDVKQDARVTAGDDVTQRMVRVTALPGSVHQRIRFIQPRARNAKGDGDHED